MTKMPVRNLKTLKKRGWWSEWALFARKTGLRFSRLRFTLSYHVILVFKQNARKNQLFPSTHHCAALTIIFNVLPEVDVMI